MMSFLLMVVFALSVSAAPNSISSFLQDAKPTTPQPLALESFLPADALGVILIENVAQLKAALAKTDFYRIASEKSATDPAAKSFREVVDTMAGRDRRAAFVFVAPSTASRQPSLAIVVQGKNRAAIEAGAAKIEETYNLKATDRIPRTSFVVANTSAQVDGEAASFARAENIFIYGQQAAVEKVARTRAESTLSSDPTFQRAREKRTPDEVVFTYINFSSLVSYLVRFMAAQPGAAADVTSLVLSALPFIGTTAIQGATISTRYQNGRALDHITVFANWERAGALSALLAFPSLQPKAAHTLPSDAPSYVSLGIDAVQIYDALLKTFGPLLSMQFGVSSVDEGVKALEQRLGFRLREELLASLGNELALAQLKSPGTASDAYQIHSLVLIEVKDAELLKGVLEKSQANRGTEAETSAETYKGRKIYPLAENISVSLIGSVAALATADEIKRLIDQLDQGKSLASAEHYKRTFGTQTAPRGIEIFVTSDILNHPRVRRAIGGEGGRRAFTEALRSNFNPTLYGAGERNSTGLMLDLSSPIGTPLLLDLFQTQWSPEAARLTANSTGGVEQPLLRLMAYFSRIFSPVVSSK
jgi:hypothetical protein